MSTDLTDRILKQTKPQFVRNLFSAYGDSRTTVNYDRFIPSRINNNWQTNFATIPDPSRGAASGKKARESGESQRDTSAYNCLLRNELLGDNIEDTKTQCDERQALTPLKSKNLFKYGTPSKVIHFFFTINVLFEF